MRVIRAIGFVSKRAFESAPLHFIFYLALMSILSFGTLLNILFFKFAVDSATQEKSLFGLSLIALFMVKVLFDIVYKIIEKTAEYFWNVIELKQAIYNTSRFTEKLSTLDIASFENANTFDKIWRSFNRIAWQLRFYLDAAIRLMGKFIELSVSIVIFFIASPLSAVIMIAANVIPIIVKTELGDQTFNIYKADSETRRKYEYTSTLVTIRETLIEIKQFQGFNFVKSKLLAIYELFSKKQAKLFKKAWFLLSVVEQLPIIAIFIFLITIAIQLQNKTISTGTFVFLFSNIFLFNSALSQLGNYLADSFVRCALYP